MQQAGCTYASREKYVRALWQLWDWRAGKLAIALFQKAFSREAWPTLQLLPDESLALSVVTNAINVYNPRDFAAGVFEAPPSSPSFSHLPSVDSSTIKRQTACTELPRFATSLRCQVSVCMPRV